MTGRTFWDVVLRIPGGQELSYMVLASGEWEAELRARERLGAHRPDAVMFATKVRVEPMQGEP